LGACDLNFCLQKNKATFYSDFVFTLRATVRLPFQSIRLAGEFFLDHEVNKADDNGGEHEVDGKLNKEVETDHTENEVTEAAREALSKAPRLDGVEKEKKAANGKNTGVDDRRCDSGCDGGKRGLVVFVKHMVNKGCDKTGSGAFEHDHKNGGGNVDGKERGGITDHKDHHREHGA